MNTPKTTTFSIPSKTFLLGEYAVLDHGPAVLLNTTPRFTLRIHPIRKKTCRHPFHEQDPCAQFIADHPTYFVQRQVVFKDPFSGRGGFGASSAAFAALYFYVHLCTHGQLDRSMDAIKSAIARYQSYTSHTPSGADLASQIKGNITFFDQMQTLRWPFSDLYFCLLKTREKIPTHQHLAALTPDQIPFSTLTQITHQGMAALTHGDQAGFCACINDYGNALIEAQLSTPSIPPMLDQIRKQPGVMAVKGCGALSADVVLVLIDPTYIHAFRSFAEPLFPYLMIGNQASAGIQCAHTNH